MAGIEVDDHLQPHIQLGNDSIHGLDGLADDWAQDGTSDIKLTESRYALVDVGQEREGLSDWMDMSTDEPSTASTPSLGLLAEQEREFVQHWSDGDEHGSTGDSFGEAFLNHEFLETNIYLEHPSTSLDFPIDEDSCISRCKPPPKSKRRVRFQCSPDPESDNNAEPKNNCSTDYSKELTWTWGVDDLKGQGPYFDPYDQSQSAESDSCNFDGYGFEIFEAGAKENRVECFYCNGLFMPREPSADHMTNWDHLCPTCIMRLCERPNQQM